MLSNGEDAVVKKKVKPGFAQSLSISVVDILWVVNAKGSIIRRGIRGKEVTLGFSHSVFVFMVEILQVFYFSGIANDVGMAGWDGGFF